MENKSHAIVAGLFTLALLAAAIFVGLWLDRDRTEWTPYQIATTLSVPGLSPQAAVRYRGLDVGKVDSITFDPDVAGQILVHISVRPDTPVTQSTFATLGYQGVTGIAYVQLDDDGSQPRKLSSSKQHGEQVARIEMRPSLFDQLQNRGLAILQQTEEIAKRINTLLDPANQKAMLDAFDNVSKAANELAAFPRQLQPTLARMPALTMQAQQTLGSLDTLSKNASALTGSLNAMAGKLQAPNGPIEKISDAAEQVGAAANKLDHETLPLANDARATIRTLNRTLESLGDRPQSVLFGSPAAAPGPGEPGFAAPAR